MMGNDGYNGWTNYETWLVSLHINNDRGLYEEVDRMTDRALDAYPRRDNLDNLTDRSAEHELEDNIESLIDRIVRDTQTEDSHLVGDLLQASICKVNFREIAVSNLEELEEAEV